MTMDSFYVGKTGKTRVARHPLFFWEKRLEYEVVVETYDTNMPSNRSQHKEWVTAEKAEHIKQLK
jgi:hypothetical protein